MNAQVRLLEQESTINELRAALKESEAQRERLMDATQILVERAGQLHMGLAEANAELAKANAARLEAEKEAKQLRELGTEILSQFHEDMPECSATRTCWVGKKQVAEWRRAFTRDETQIGEE